ncbi:hypothetical protein [Bacteriovorax stolpii]|nr:hypothetical protein [Bacteriovorax stolpii]
MKVFAATDIRAFTASIAVHGLVVLVASAALYRGSVQTLELTGGRGNGKTISLDGINFSRRASGAPAAAKSPVKEALATSSFTKTVTPTEKAITTDSVSAVASAHSSAGTGGNGAATGPGASGLGFGTGAGDFDGGVLFSQIKRHFETRLGATLVIKEDQLIKIKITLESDGTVTAADLIQGKLDMSTLRKILSVAKNIPLKNLWKSSTPIPSELIIPLFLTSNS